MSSGGAGSDGANGGDGGIIEVSVHEEDMHLLIAVGWNIRGGDGGVRGVNGKGGRGGPGGPGGRGWSEYVLQRQKFLALEDYTECDRAER